MGKKVKVGKQRRDKAYWAAKEIGYRSRASFKLVQLNRKWEFLQKSSVCIDLCAAPGSWMQVCRENMPMSSLVVGVDLVPIKPITGCIALQEDITTEKCKASLRKELKTARADLVLHDGAPNVGKNWIHDAYQQSLLTLHAFKLATCFLAKGGWFVTKVFRSKDYQSLIWVLSQFFNKVHATKPAASRNESAEIFVVCQSYLAPDKIDPKFLDPKHVFSEVETENRKLTTEIINPEKAKKKPTSEGYGDGVTVLYKEAKASEFIMANEYIRILNEANKIIIDSPRIREHPRTTAEIQECLKDLKVLGMKELRNLKKWRDTLKKEFEALDNEKAGDDTADSEVPAILQKTEEEKEDEELNEIEDQISQLKTEERRKERRKKKKEQKEKQKRMERLNLKMIIPGDQGPTQTEDELFKITGLKSCDDLTSVLDCKPDQVAEDSDEEEEKEKKLKYVRFEKDKGTLDSDTLWYDENERKEGNLNKKDDDTSDEEDETEDLGLADDDEEESVGKAEPILDCDDTEKHPLLTTIHKLSAEEKKARKAELWFEKIGDLDSEDELEDAEIQKAVSRVTNKGGTILQRPFGEANATESGYTSGSDADEDAATTNATKAESSTGDNGNISDKYSDTDDDSSSDDEDITAGRGGADENGFEIVKQPKITKRKALSPEELALGEEMVKSKKTKRDIMDAGWNRFMFDDSNLPDWFEKEEDLHMKRRPDVDPDVVDKYRDRGKEINVKTIKKVVEAKARRKRRMTKSMDKAKKKAAALLENDDVGSREKTKEIAKMYKAARAEGKLKDVAYVVAKKHRAGKRAQRPSGVKGPFKQVDPRMKSDNRTKRTNATKKKGKKRTLKGKQAKPTKQFNTNR